MMPTACLAFLCDIGPRLFSPSRGKNRRWPVASWCRQSAPLTSVGFASVLLFFLHPNNAHDSAPISHRHCHPLSGALLVQLGSNERRGRRRAFQWQHAPRHEKRKQADVRPRYARRHAHLCAQDGKKTCTGRPPQPHTPCRSLLFFPPRAPSSLSLPAQSTPFFFFRYRQCRHAHPRTIVLR